MARPFLGSDAEGARKRVRGWSHTTQRYHCFRTAQLSWSLSPLPLLVWQFDMAAEMAESVELAKSAAITS
jgi:hypothetical protein